MCAHKYHYSEPTLTLPNLTTILEKAHWYNVGMWMGIPDAKRAMIRQQYASGDDDSQCRQKVWELYLLEYPLPSWQQVAEALYLMDHLKELEVVQKKYLKGG